MSENCIHLPPEAVKDYLREYGKGSESKDYELITALVAERLYSDMNDLDSALIGVPVKPEFYRTHHAGKVDVSEVKNVFDSQKEDSLMDFCIMEGKSAINKLGNSYGWGVQAKRFGLEKEKKDEDAFIAFINSMKRQYAPNEYTLMIFVEIDGTLDLKKIQDEIDFESFPFDNLILLSGAEGLIRIHELYPEIGYVEYAITDLL